MMRTLMIASVFVVILGCELLAPPDEYGHTPFHPEYPCDPRAVVFHGDTLVEQKILSADTIVIAKMTSFSSDVVAVEDGKYSAMMEFNLAVIEYLKGAGPSDIVAVWVDGESHTARAGARGAGTYLKADRDAQWDGREAAIFLYDEIAASGTALHRQLEPADRYLLAFGDPCSPDDRYSLHSETDKTWLPAANASLTGDDREFLLEAPSQTTETTISLADLKKLIREVAAEYEGGDGSDAHKYCVTRKYNAERAARHFRGLDGGNVYVNPLEATSIESGQPAGAALHERESWGNYPDQRAKTWLEGEYAALFYVAQGDAAPQDIDNDGKLTAGADRINYTETFKTARPLPAGEYKLDRKELWAFYQPCNYVVSFDWTITVAAPSNAVHEAFFDPAKLPNGIGADEINGTLNPSTFSVNGTATKIERIQWNPPGIVKVHLKPSVNLSDRHLDFIALNGSRTLRLDFNDAAKSPDGSLEWTICYRPWNPGDQLMLRISQSPPEPLGAAPIGSC